MDLNNLINQDEIFAEEINQLVNQNKCTVMEAVIEWADLNELEYEFVASLVKKNMALQARIQKEAENLHFLKRTQRLPI